MPHLFVYGSLMYDAVWNELIKRPHFKEAATLHGFSRHQLKSASYPGIRPKPGAYVKGQLLHNVQPNEFKRLDAFEGKYYQRRCVYVHTSSTLKTVAQTYIFKQKYYFLLSSKDWSESTFKNHYLEHFFKHYT